MGALLLILNFNLLRMGPLTIFVRIA